MKKVNLLIIENDVDDGIFLREIFKEINYDDGDFRFFKDSDDAFRYFTSYNAESNTISFDNTLILLNLVHPLKKSYSFLSDLKSNSHTQLMSVWGLFDHIDEIDLNRSVTAGIEQFFKKPYGYNNFKELILRVIDLWKSKSELTRSSFSFQ